VGVPTRRNPQRWTGQPPRTTVYQDRLDARAPGFSDLDSSSLDVGIAGVGIGILVTINQRTVISCICSDDGI